jgi:uncharacterized protein YggU (UPF0235/DUF167 family)
VPRAASTEIAGVHDGAVRIRVAAAPEKGKANAAAAAALSAALGALPVRLERGAASRRKRFVVVGASAAQVRRLLASIAER